MYFVSYAAGQVLPTAVGGDAVRIIEHSRRRPDAKATTAAAVFMERVLGSAGTLVLVAVGLAVAVGRYDDVRFLVVLELVFVAAMIVLGLLLFSRRLGLTLERRLFPLGRKIKLEKPLQSLYWAMHEYRLAPGTLAAVLGVTIVAQFLRVIAIWLCGEAVGADVSPVVYIILGPLLFLVQMVPFTLNGIGLREAFFVVFLGRFGVPEDVAFAAGFLFYAVSVATALPGGVILLWRSVRPPRARPVSGLDRHRLLQRPGAPRALPGGGGGRRPRGGRRRQRLGGREPGARARAVSVRAAARAAGERRLRRREQRRDGGGRRATSSCSSTPTPGRSGTRSSGWRPSPASGRVRASSGRGCATPTARSSAPCAAGRRPWRLATEYLFLRRLGRRTRAFNAFYGAGFDHESVRRVEVVKGAVMLVRREAYEATGGFDPDFFMYGEEMDLCYRAGKAGWEVVFDPGAEFVHVGGVSTGARWGERPDFGPMRREQLRGHLRFIAKHQGARSAERARRLLAASFRLRAALFRGEAGRAFAEAAAWLRSGSVPELLAGRG